MSIKQLFCFCAGLGLFCLPLIHAWMTYPLGIESVFTGYSALGGILPWSDANGYHQGAHYFLQHGFLDSWNTRRPLNAILLAIRLWLTNNNFQAALIVQALLCGVSCLLVATAVARRFGKMAALATLLILFLFSAVFTPTTMSETLGLTLGCLAFVLLWRAILSRELWLFFFSGLLWAIGLNTRAGAFLILPLLVMWLGYQFRDRTVPRGFNGSISFVFAFGTILGFLYNWILIWLYTDPTNTGIMHANFASTVFGLVSGGKGWYYAYQSHPTIAHISEAEAAKFLYLKSLEIFKNNPFLLIMGVLKSWAGTFKGLFSFFQYQLPERVPMYMVVLIRLLGAFVLCIGLYRLKALYKVYRNEVGLVNIGLFGIFLSAGIIWTDGGYRVFAVTVPFFAVAVGLVVGSCFFRPNRLASEPLSLGWETPVTLILSCVLLFSALGLPQLMDFASSLKGLKFSDYKQQEETIIARQIASSPHLNLDLQPEKFKSSILRSIVEEQAKDDFLVVLRPDILIKPMVLGCVYDLSASRMVYVLGTEELFSLKNTLVALRVTKVSGNVVKVQSYEVLDAK